jgi:hypothetical protein
MSAASAPGRTNLGWPSLGSRNISVVWLPPPGGGERRAARDGDVFGRPGGIPRAVAGL